MESELQRLCDSMGVKMVAAFGAVELPDDWKDKRASAYRVHLRYRGRTLTTPFFCGSACGEPKAADVLSSLCLDASCGSDSFEDFCSNLGYDQDSRKAERIYKACAAMAPRLRRFLGDDFDTFASAEH